MPTYIQVSEADGDEPIEVPCEDDDNNSILLSTLTSLFPGASGLKYRNAETGTVRGIRLIGGRLQPPDDGWGTTSVYCCAFAKDNKRKSKDQSSTPPSKRQDSKNQKTGSSTKKQKLEEERARKKALIEEERARKEALREEERVKREALKEEERVRKEAQKEEERVRREEEKAKKEAQKEEERLRKEEERLKEKARKEALKEEERLKKEEERIRKEEEKLKEKEKENQKQEKQKNILRNFFIKKSSDESVNRKSVSNTECTANGLFLPFQLGLNQTRAPIVPELASKRFNPQILDQLIVSQDSNKLYFDLLKSVEYKPLRTISVRTEPEIIIESQSEDEENDHKKYRVKHLQFHENVRPPYRGTYRKTSSKLKATQPFVKDSDLFDYEVDSDEEWEEGGPGESLDGSDSGSVDGSVKDDDYEIDNDFFVPHGYLSEDENDENEDKTPVENITSSDNCDQKDNKHQPLLKEQVLMAERNRSFSSNLTPKVLGCVWLNDPSNKNNVKFIELLQSYKRMSIITK